MERRREDSASLPLLRYLNTELAEVAGAKRSGLPADRECPTVVDVIGRSVDPADKTIRDEADSPFSALGTLEGGSHLPGLQIS